ncbi:MAG TPA: hypothetical protein VGI63_00715 [Verrucomicrobiae bacterium]
MTKIEKLKIILAGIKIFMKISFSKLAATGGLLLLTHIIQAQEWVQWKVTAGGNDHWYMAVLNTNGLTWTQAYQLARNQGGYLATITSSAENDFVFGLINSPDFFSGGPRQGGSGPLIGGFQPDGSQEPDGGWTWVTGETWGFTSWASGEPNNYYSTGENRLQYYSGVQGVPAPTWNDLYSEDNASSGYIIERETTPVPLPSGFYGQSFVGASGGGLLFPVLGSPVKSIVSVYDGNGKLLSRVPSNPVGQFYKYVSPGSYTLVGALPGTSLPPAKLNQSFLATNLTDTIFNITVNTNQLTPVELNF